MTFYSLLTMCTLTAIPHLIIHSPFPHFANTLGLTIRNRGLALFWCEEDSKDQLLTATSRMSGRSCPYCGRHTYANSLSRHVDAFDRRGLISNEQL